jgi:TM2 domain-containing membrane protein YozV
MTSTPPSPEPALPPAPASPAPLSYPMVAAPARLPKNPWVAALLSIFPGLGQVYNGQIGKAFAFFGAWLGCMFGAIQIDPMPFALMIPFAYLFNLVDAWKSANQINQRFLGGKAEPADESIESPAWGGVLVAIGAVLLASNLGWINLRSVERFWPVILIVAGLVFIQRSLQARKASAGTGDGGQL